MIQPQQPPIEQNKEITKTEPKREFECLNSRKNMLVYYGLDKEEHMVYEIPCFLNDNVACSLMKYIYENEDSPLYTVRNSEQTKNLLNKATQYDMPQNLKNNIHLVRKYNNKEYHLILANDIHLNLVIQHVYVCLSKKNNKFTDIENFVADIITKTKHVPKKIMLYTSIMSPQYGLIWSLGNPIYRRDLNTIYLSKKIKDDLINDIDNFLSKGTEALYCKMGVPYKRCYLFYGLPGTGKTSLVKAIASHYGKNIAILKLKSKHFDDTDIHILVESMPKDSILLIEDLDKSFTGEYSTQCRDTNIANAFSKGHVTLSGIINMLDGVCFYERQLIFITCNNADAFSNIYMRPGRIDKITEFGALTEESARYMLETIFPQAQKEKIINISRLIGIFKKLVPAEFQTLILENKDIDKLSYELDKKINTLKTSYADLSTKCQNLFTQHYQGYYGFDTNNMVL